MAVMTDIYEKARELGRHSLRVHFSPLVDFALDIVKSAANGDVGADDTEDLYLTFYDSTIKRSHLQGARSKAAQVSKLRSIVRLGEEFPSTAETLLREVVTMHHQMVTTEGKQAVPVYHAMILVARAQLRTSRLLGKADIKRALTPR